MADYTTLKAAIASVIKTNGNQEITGLLLQQTLHSMLDGVNTTKQDTINFVINTANKFLRDDGTFQEIPTPTGSFTNNVYLSSLPSDIATYKILSYEPDSSEVITTNSISASEGNKLVATYLYPVGVDTNLVPAGLWSFIFNSYVSSTVGNTNIGVQCFARAINGSETTLFTVWSETIGSTSIKETKINYSGQTYNVNTSDRIGIRVLLRTTSVPSLNVSFIVGDGRGSYFNTPISIRHKQIRSLNEDPNYQHITQTEKTNFQTAYTDRFKWDGGSSGLNAVTGRESLGVRIGIDVLAYRTFGSAANNNTNDFLAYNGVAVDSSKLGGQLPSYYIGLINARALLNGSIDQDFSAKKLTSATLLLPQTAPSLAASEIGLYALESGFSGELPSGAGSVTSIALTMPTGFAVSGSPITESGTFGVTFASGYFLPTTTQFATKADVSLIGAANGIAPLDSGGKVALQYLPSTLLKYMGVWNASTNTPTLTSPDTNRKGQVWNVSVAGTQFGIAFKLGDWLIYNDSGVAEKSDNSDDVVSVNGYTGSVTLKTSDIAEQTNLYYTDARVKAYSDLNYLGILAKAADSDKLDGQDSTDYFRTLSSINLADINNTIVKQSGTSGVNYTGYSRRLVSFSGNGGSASSVEMLFHYDPSATDFIQVRTSIDSVALTDWVALYNSANSNSTSFAWSASKLTSTTLILPQSAPSLTSGEMAIYGLESGFSGEMPGGAGSVTSISMVVPTGLSVTPATITESGTFTISYASGYQMMTSTESSKLAGIEANANNYTLPTATNSVLGGVKIGSNITITDGVISVATPYTLPTATDSVLGGVKIGTNVTITDGVISVHNPVTLGTANGLSLSTQVLSLGLASASANGALSSTDWSTFNGKQAKLVGTGTSSLVRVNTSGVIAYDDSTYLTGNQTITLSGIITGSGTTAITTAIADGALSIAKTNGLQTALDGKLSTTGKAADSDKLDGQDSTYFATAAQLNAANLTSGYLPYWNGSSLANSPINSDGKNIGIGVSFDTSWKAKIKGVYPLTILNSSGNPKFEIFADNNQLKVYGGIQFIGYSDLGSTQKYIISADTGSATFNQVTMTENINTNLRIPKVAPTNPTSGEYYFYIVE